ncbi:hypothetical protein LIER_40664 [Lithospermum erythrorhizon]|uniref:Uncharacterized protein n=1 Tax=Lithospermum erythrorhizon TaxID=34254 RepID=A0AAV3QXW7_LITER
MYRSTFNQFNEKLGVESLAVHTWNREILLPKIIKHNPHSKMLKPSFILKEILHILDLLSAILAALTKVDEQKVLSACLLCLETESSISMFIVPPSDTNSLINCLVSRNVMQLGRTFNILHTCNAVHQQEDVQYPTHVSRFTSGRARNKHNCSAKIKKLRFHMICVVVHGFSLVNKTLALAATYCVI